MYDIYKSLHIIFVVTWFAGLFYIVRLFVYHSEAKEINEPVLINQYQIMQRRLWYGITWPSAILATIFGLLLLHSWLPLNQGWIHSKLFFIFLLWVYHIRCGHYRKKIKNTLISSQFFRIYNEIATLLLFAIVFLVVLKDSLNALYATTAFIGLSIILFMAIRVYKKMRQ